MMDTWGAHVHGLRPAAVKRSLHSFWCSSHLEQRSSQTKSNSSSLSERKMRKEGRRKAYFIFCTANHFYVIPGYATYGSRGCEAWVHQERTVFGSSLLRDVCSQMSEAERSQLRTSQHLCRPSVYTLPWLSRVMRKREVKCFRVKSVFILVARKEQSS